MKKFGFILFLHFHSFVESQTYELSIPPNETSSYEYADFKIWIDNSIDTLKGLYWSVHGLNGDSREVVNELSLRTTAANNQCALMGVHLSNMDMELLSLGRFLDGYVRVWGAVVDKVLINLLESSKLNRNLVFGHQIS